MRTRLGVRREDVNLERYGWNERFRSLFDSTTNGDLVPARVIRVDREAVNTVFPEIDEAAQGCRYGDCRHEAEPGCVVHEAIEDGTIDPRRPESFLRLRREVENLERRRDESKRHENRARERSFGKMVRQAKKIKGQR
jgi:hypothetical protein